MQMQMLLAGAVLIFLALLGAKLYFDSQGKKGSLRTHHPKRRARVSSELVAQTGDASVRVRVVDTDGRAGLALLDDDRLVVVQAEWQGGKSSTGAENVALRTRLVEPTQLVSAHLREVAASESTKDGKSATWIGAVELILFVDDLDDPVVVIDFLDDDVLCGSVEHEAAQTEAQRWEGRVRALVFRGQRQAQVKGQLQALQARARQP